jgi:hypothetical protein
MSAAWRKSSYSGSDANCVEVSNAARLVEVRDTKDHHGTALIVSAGAWRRFTMEIKGQELAANTGAGSPYAAYDKARL